MAVSAKHMILLHFRAHVWLFVKIIPRTPIIERVLQLFIINVLLHTQSDVSCESAPRSIPKHTHPVVQWFFTDVPIELLRGAKLVAVDIKQKLEWHCEFGIMWPHIKAAIVGNIAAAVISL